MIYGALAHAWANREEVADQKGKAATAKLAATVLSTVVGPLAALQTALKSTTTTDAFALGSAELLVAKVEGMLAEAHKTMTGGGTTMGYDVKDVMQAKKDLLSVTGTALHACMHACTDSSKR